MFFIVGLGNPGEKYEKTRHNIGFKIVDYLADEYQIPVQKKSDLYESGSGLFLTHSVLLAKPVTFMNRSGLAVRRLLDYFHESASQLIIIHDDLDIPFGQIRIKLKGGAGGHNGVSSIIEALQTDEFLRIRAGVGRPAEKEEAVSYVLSPFLKEEQAVLVEVIRQSAGAVKEILSAGPQKAMNVYNQKQ